VIATLGIALAYGQWRLSQPFAMGKPVSVAIVQPSIERQFRWLPTHRRANLDLYLSLTRTAAGADLIFWPEHAIDFYLQENSPHQNVLLQPSRELKADLVLGGRYYSRNGKGIDYHNSVFLIHRGRVAGRYDKQRLLPFAEENRLPWLFPDIVNKYMPGRHVRALPSPFSRIGTFVCFESLYPDLVRRVVSHGVELLANPSNDDWFGHPAPARHQLEIASLRAIENRRYLVRATATGYSAVIDPHGRIIALSSFRTPEVVKATIRPSRVLTPYRRWGDVTPWIAIAVVVVSSFLSRNWLKEK
jgi:apolipoprotein N-acyltransferase